MKSRLGIFYLVLVALLLILGAWWLLFLTRVGQDQAEVKLQKLANDRIHAAFLLDAEPGIRQNPEAWLGPSFPNLRFTREDGTVKVEIDPAVIRGIQDEAKATRNMFLYEGFFFILLLVAGSTILYLSWRSEQRYTQTRELFLAGVTHEFKTPLASLRLYTETLCRQGLRDEDRARIREHMIEDVGRLQGLVDDILAMSAADTFEQGPRERVDLDRECAAVVDDTRGFAAAHGAEFRVVPGGPAYADVNRMSFALALRNLLVNAVHHSPDPVTVTVTVRRGSENHRVAVRDDGPGIPRRLQEKVFDLFFSARRGSRSAGGGIGLHLVKRIVENTGGRMQLESDPGAGSTFTMVLPAAPAPDEPEGQP